MKVIKWLDENLEEYMMVFLLAVIAVVMMIQIVMRYAFGNALSWAEELCRYCYIWFVFLSAGYCTRKKKNLKVDIILQALPRIPKAILAIISEIIIAAFYGYMAYHSIGVVSNLYKTMRMSPALNIPVYLVYAATLVGFSLGVIRGVQAIVSLIKEMINPTQVPETPAEEEQIVMVDNVKLDGGSAV